MKKTDFVFIVGLLVLIAPFFLFDSVYQFYLDTTAAHPYVMAFVKFALLATIGEMLGLRIKSGIYNYRGFGLSPRAVVWGFFGIWIAVAMKTFAAGSPVMLESFGVEGVVAAMKTTFTPEKLLGSFFISVMMNTLFAPVFMTLHKITDTHILNNGGSLKALLIPIPMTRIISSLNWTVQWRFVFKKTIPLFWIPAHTVTFLLPSSYQVLFAASLSIVLGVFLSVAAVLSREKKETT